MRVRNSSHTHFQTARRTVEQMSPRNVPVLSRSMCMVHTRCNLWPSEPSKGETTVFHNILKSFVGMKRLRHSFFGLTKLGCFFTGLFGRSRGTTSIVRWKILCFLHCDVRLNRAIHARPILSLEEFGTNNLNLSTDRSEQSFSQRRRSRARSYLSHIELGTKTTSYWRNETTCVFFNWGNEHAN